MRALLCRELIGRDHVAGLADDQPMSLLVDGHQAGSVSMAAYTVGMPAAPS